MKKIVVGIIVLILVVLIPYFPYKKAFCKKVYEPSKIHIQVRYHETDGELLVVYGKKHLKKYVVENNLKGININKIDLIGKEPYSEIADFEIGNPIFHDFVVIGNFVEYSSGNGILTFDVENWYPVYQSVKLKDIEAWHMYNYSAWRVVILIALILAISFDISNKCSR